MARPRKYPPELLDRGARVVRARRRSVCRSVVACRASESLSPDLGRLWARSRPPLPRRGWSPPRVSSARMRCSSPMWSPQARWPVAVGRFPAPCRPVHARRARRRPPAPEPMAYRQPEPADGPTSRSLSRGSYRPSPGGSTRARSAVDHPLGGRRVHPEAGLDGDALCPYSHRSSSELTPVQVGCAWRSHRVCRGAHQQRLTTSGQLIGIEARGPKRRSSVSSAHATSSFPDTAVTISAEWGVAPHRPIRSVEASPSGARQQPTSTRSPADLSAVSGVETIHDPQIEPA